MNWELGFMMCGANIAKSASPISTSGIIYSCLASFSRANSCETVGASAAG
jgi:hypothetical protein